MKSYFFAEMKMIIIAVKDSIKAMSYSHHWVMSIIDCSFVNLIESVNYFRWDSYSYSDFNQNYICTLVLVKIYSLIVIVSHYYIKIE